MIAQSRFLGKFGGGFFGAPKDYRDVHLVSWWDWARTPSPLDSVV